MNILKSKYQENSFWLIISLILMTLGSLRFLAYLLGQFNVVGDGDINTGIKNGLIIFYFDFESVYFFFFL